MPKLQKHSKKSSKSSQRPKPSVIVPTSSAGSGTSLGASSASSISPAMPKTPADEGIEFFQSNIKDGEASVRVYELKLDPDGGPSKETSVELPFFFSPVNFHPNWVF
jgi:glycogen debranching enzyme